MILILDDYESNINFAPLSLTRPVSELRTGMFTNVERWKLFVPEAVIYYKTERYLQNKYPKSEHYDVWINANFVPELKLVNYILAMPQDSSLFKNGVQLAQKGDGALKLNLDFDVIYLKNRWDLYLLNDQILRKDFEFYTKNKVSQSLSSSNTLIGEFKDLFIEEGAKVEASILNTSTGPIYIGKDAEVMEGSILRGPIALGEHAAIKMGAKIYGACSFGPHVKVGGEVSNSIFQAYSNKGHDGFLGNSIIGEWCNLGADTNSSNLKNNYSAVSTYSYKDKKEIKTDVQFMGLSMGDHSKCGINTMFNTATVVGVSCNVFGANFPPKYIPSFSWGGSEQLVEFKFSKAIEYANQMMARRGLQLDENEIEILRYLSKVSR